jgi:ribokinase
MNETESCILSSSPPTAATTESIPVLLTLAKSFLARGVNDTVIITLGGKGLVYATAAGEEGHVAAEMVKVVDTTAAGDTFVGGYAVERASVLASGGKWEVEHALKFANRAAAETVQRAGAMSAIPYLKEVQRSVPL